MKMTFEQLTEAMGRGDDFLLLTHGRPDGDTLGSAAALCLGLRSLGKRAWLHPNPEVTERYKEMTDGLWAPEGFSAGTVCSVDVADRALLCRGCPENVDIAIDHHSSHREFGRDIYCDSSMAACGEIIYELLTALGVRLDVPMADALYTAVSTDTGCFRFNNTTPHSHMVAGECMAAGCRFQEINFRCFRIKTKARVALEGHLYSNLVMGRNGYIAMAVISRDLIESLGATEDDLDNLSSLLGEIQGVMVGALLTQTKDRKGYKVSMRSSAVDVAEICSIYGGGGHAGAAGCTVYTEDEEMALGMIEGAIEGTLDG